MKKIFLLFLILFCQAVAGPYHNFKVAVYCRSYEVRKMANLNWLDSIWTEISHQVHVDKVYLETHRDLVMVQKDTLEAVKKYFHSKNIQTAGGITFTINERNRFQTFCYSKEEDRKKVKQIVEYTARHFDEIILDDFFFTSCKCEACIKAKGDKSWTEYRLNLMAEAAENLVVKPAKTINPDVKVVIKYPNWYAHFQGLGFNLEKEPQIFDGLYTGTETRDAILSAQHLQPYLGYAIFRYFENIKPKGNGGGWVDTGGTRFLDRYAEQLWLTLFAKAPEITLFDFRQVQRPLTQFPERPWKEQATSFNREEMMKPVNGIIPTTIARAAGYTFEKIDPVLAKLGNPVGIKCYRPFHALGEDFLPTFLGMAGLPIDIVPQFPADESMILLTESAAYDKQIVAKIKKQLLDGKSVTITSGLLKALQGKGIEDIAELRYTDHKALTDEYVTDFRIIKGEKKILIPQIKYLTNDSWELASAIDGPNGWPVLHDAAYAKGHLYILTIPENYADLYHLPAEILSKIRATIGKYQPVYMQGPANVSLFIYDNNMTIVESFNDEVTHIKLTTSKDIKLLKDIITQSQYTGETEVTRQRWGLSKNSEKKVFKITIPPHSYKAFELIE